MRQSWFFGTRYGILMKTYFIEYTYFFADIQTQFHVKRHPHIIR